MGAENRGVAVDGDADAPDRCEDGAPHISNRRGFGG